MTERERERANGRETESDTELDIHKQTQQTTHWGHRGGHSKDRLRQTGHIRKENKPELRTAIITKLSDSPK